MEYLSDLALEFAANPYWIAIFSFVAILIFAPIPEEGIVFVCAYLSAKHGHGVWIPTWIACVLGMFITDYWFFLWFKLLGRKVFDIAFIAKHFPPGPREKGLKRIKKYGAWAVFIVRFIPGGIRNPTFAMAGLANLSHKKFILASLSGCILVSIITFSCGYFLADYLPPVEELVILINKKGRVVITVILSIFLLVWLGRRAYKKYSV